MECLLLLNNKPTLLRDYRKTRLKAYVDGEKLRTMEYLDISEPSDFVSFRTIKVKR